MRRWISWDRPRTRPPSPLPELAGAGGPGQHGILRGDPAPPGAPAERRHLVLDGGGAEHPGAPPGDEAGALGELQVVRFQGQGPQLAFLSASISRHKFWGQRPLSLFIDQLIKKWCRQLPEPVTATRPRLAPFLERLAHRVDNHFKGVGKGGGGRRPTSMNFTTISLATFSTALPGPGRQWALSCLEPRRASLRGLFFGIIKVEQSASSFRVFSFEFRVMSYEL